VNPICVALDAREPERNLAMARAVADEVGFLKVGLTSFTAGGADFAREIASIKPMFVDLKLHDIPAQVASAVENVGSIGASVATVHATGGPEMIKAAVAAAPDALKIVGVTVLTSIDDGTLDAIGIRGPSSDAVLRLAELALGAGADGLVCSPLEVERIRARFGTDPYLVVPGIRAAGAPSDDQKRTLSAAEAVAAGADLIVVGRPVTGAEDPAAAARELFESLS
jgi:orotidine-5'-phosphate decarboxylase